MRVSSRWPDRSNRHNSTRSACAENSAKLTPLPSQVAPSGSGWPGHTLVEGMLSLSRFCREDQRPERRQAEPQRMGMAVHWVRFSIRLAGVADAAAAVNLSVGIDALDIAAGARHADPIVMPRHRREIAHDDRQLMRVAAAP